MKILFLFLFAFVFEGFASQAYSQNSLVSINLENSTVREVLTTIEEQTDYNFFYNEGLIDMNREVSVVVENKELSGVLSSLFNKTEISYELRGEQIILTNQDFAIQSDGEQDGLIKGIVTDTNGEPLPGVTVVVKGTTIGVITDINGAYTINVPSGSTSLQFSFVGMKSEEFAIEGNKSINVSLADDSIGLDEVIAVGYGAMKKSDLTGAVKRINTTELDEIANVSIIETLKGSAPGLNIGASTGAGAQPSLSVRGQNTFSIPDNGIDENAPLIVVDGQIYRGNLIDLNTSDIESVDVLKDASSAAIYGSQASNGVLLITTKKGVTSKPVINYSGSYTIQTPSNSLKPLNGEESAKFLTDAHWENSRIGPDYLEENPNFSLSPYFKTQAISEGYENGVDNDWWGLLTRNGVINNQNVSVNGRGKNVGYFASAGFTDVKGFMKNDDYKKYNYRINIDTKVTDWMDFGIESFLVSSNYSGVSPTLYSAYILQPWAPIKDADGEYVLRPEGLEVNPYLQMEQPDSDKRLNISANLHADIKLPFVKGLNYRINFNQNYRTRKEDRYDPQGANLTGEGYRKVRTDYTYALDHILSYNRVFNGVHKVGLTLGYGIEKYNTDLLEATAQNFKNGDLGYNKLEAGDPALNEINTDFEEETSLYNMGRFMYSYNNRYLFTATVRRDGYSGFGSNNKIGVFPSVALGWIASEEEFVQADWLDYLKFRSSYGTTGRRGLQRYQTLAKIKTESSIVFGDGGSATTGQWINTMANNDLGWETTTGLNFGLDFAILGSRIFGNIEYYANETKDVLYEIQLPQTTGFKSVATNIGGVKNHGLEFSITGKIIKSKDLQWDATLNFTRNRNEIVSLLGKDDDHDGREDDLVANKLFIGEPQNVIYDYEVIGMWQLADEAAGEIPDGFFPGTYKIANVEGEGYSASDDKKILGYQDPSYRFSISSRLKYKNWSLYVLVNSIQGGKKYYMGDASPYSFGNYQKLDNLNYSNAPGWDYWMPENPNAKYRRLDKPSQYAARPYDQRNFVRLQNVSLSYTFDKNKLKKYGIGNLKVYMSGTNLLTFTKWDGWDPETGTGIGAHAPVMSNYTMGVNIEF